MSAGFRSVTAVCLEWAKVKASSLAAQQEEPAQLWGQYAEIAKGTVPWKMEGDFVKRNIIVSTVDPVHEGEE